MNMIKLHFRKVINQQISDDQHLSKGIMTLSWLMYLWLKKVMATNIIICLYPY